MRRAMTMMLMAWPTDKPCVRLDGGMGTRSRLSHVVASSWRDPSATTDGVVLDLAKRGDVGREIAVWHKCSTIKGPSYGINNVIRTMFTQSSKLLGS
ncbi:hypothetical protein PspLS_11981 [Pyricularia sp. CBS 133598]|nr:hypothetical protein PspLS_11981 [Pyricularia sp. CBS 133598]